MEMGVGDTETERDFLSSSSQDWTRPKAIFRYSHLGLHMGIRDTVLDPSSTATKMCFSRKLDWRKSDRANLKLEAMSLEWHLAVWCSEYLAVLDSSAGSMKKQCI